MADVELIREQRLGFTAQGQAVSVDEYYIKLKVGFRQLLFELKGCPHSFFLAVALHEAEIALRGAAPLSLSEIAAHTGYSRRACVYAAAALLGRNLVVLAGTRPDGAHEYRPSGFAWFGADHTPPSARSSRSEEALDARAGMQNLHTPSPLPASDSTVTHSAEPRRPMQKTTYPLCKKEQEGVQKGAARTVVVDVVVQNETQAKTIPSFKQQQQQTTDARVEKILEHLGVELTPHSIRRIPFERAREWLYWFHVVLEQPNSFTHPSGFAAKQLRERPDAHPPMRPNVERLMRARPHAYDAVWDNEASQDARLEALLQTAAAAAPLDDGAALRGELEF